MIRKSSTALGADLHELFTAMIADRKYEDLMDESKKLNIKTRLDAKHGEEARQERQVACVNLEKQIAETLRDMNRDLLILMKTNHYLRAIDTKLGHPTNSFNQVNEATWEVFKREVGKNLSSWDYAREAWKFYYLKFGLFFYYISVACRRMIGLSVSREELEDFDMDFTEHKHSHLQV